VKIQKPIKGGRKQVSGRVEQEIRKAIEHEARTYNCSMSYVIKTVLKEYFKIKGDNYYDA
jgi:hypothetical protein